MAGPRNNGRLPEGSDWSELQLLGDQSPSNRRWLPVAYRRSPRNARKPEDTIPAARACVGGGRYRSRLVFPPPVARPSISVERSSFRLQEQLRSGNQETFHLAGFELRQSAGVGPPVAHIGGLREICG